MCTVCLTSSIEGGSKLNLTAAGGTFLRCHENLERFQSSGSPGFYFYGYYAVFYSSQIINFGI